MDRHSGGKGLSRLKSGIQLHSPKFLDEPILDPQLIQEIQQTVVGVLIDAFKTDITEGRLELHHKR